MPSALAEAHIESEKRIRDLLVRELERIWRALVGYDRADVDEWLAGALPAVEAAQRASVALTDGYISRVLERPPMGISAEDLIGAAVRNGTEPSEAYQRPFATVWSALSDGVTYDDAVDAGLARAQTMARFDVQASMRATAGAIQDADDQIFGFSRAANPDACEFCRLIDGAYVKHADAMALHPGCGCGLEVLTAPHPRAAKLPSGVEVHEHGEMGPTLAGPDHHFRGPGEPPTPTKGADRGRSREEIERELTTITAALPQTKPSQRSSDLDQVFADAERTMQAHRELLDLGQGLEELLGADSLIADDNFGANAKQLSAKDRPVVAIPPMKKRAAAEEKLLRKRDKYGPEGLSDLVRASVLVEKLEDMGPALRTTIDYAQSQGWSVHEPVNGFESGGVGGYRDFSIVLQSPEGHVTELQFHIDALWEAKFRGGGHDLYELRRKLLAIPEADRTEADWARMQELADEMQALYDNAYASSWDS